MANEGIGAAGFPHQILKFETGCVNTKCRWHASHICSLLDTVRGFALIKMCNIGEKGWRGVSESGQPQLSEEALIIYYFKTKIDRYLTLFAPYEVYFNKFSLYLQSLHTRVHLTEYISIK